MPKSKEICAPLFPISVYSYFPKTVYCYFPITTVRIRKKSIKKELLKQVSETGKVIDAIWKSIRPKRSRKAIRYRLQQRLISMSVGRVDYGSIENSICWTAGFNVLIKNPIVTNQIRGLDRNREKQLKRLERHLDKITTPKGIQRKSRGKLLKINGSRFSYHYQFFKEGA